MPEDEGEECCGIVGILALVGVYLVGLYFFFTIAFIPILAIAAAIMTGLILINFSKAFHQVIKEGSQAVEEPSGDQPAYKPYFFHQAFIDLKNITKRNYELNKESINKIIEEIKSRLFSEERTLYTWPIGLALFVAIPVAIIVGGAVYLLITAIHVSIVLIAIAGAFGIAMLFRGIEYLNMFRWRIFLACPTCYEKFKLPIYSCTDCGAKHTKLVPGQYGVFKRKCKCGNLLPTLFLNGKNKLPSTCPNGHPLTEDIGVSINVHYPIVGGAMSGKSAFLVASMLVLSEKSENEGFDFSFPEKKSEDTFIKSKDNFKKGIPPEKTAVEDKPRAFLVKMQKKEGRRPPHLIYIYDAAGEIFESLDSMRIHKYFEYISGIFFLIDPFSIPVVKKEFDSELSDHSEAIKPSTEDPNAIFSRMVTNLEQHGGQKGKYKIPIAVVIAKSDAFGLENKIRGTHLALPSEEKKQPSEKDIESEKIRTWLNNNGQSNFVRSVENMFENVKYFSCSALGHMSVTESDSGTEFTPLNIDAAIDWVFSFRKVLD